MLPCGRDKPGQDGENAIGGADLRVNPACPPDHIQGSDPPAIGGTQTPVIKTLHPNSAGAVTSPENRQEETMVHVITVAATEGGWAVRHDVAANAMLFTSGAKAERAARKRGVTLAQSGAPTEIQIFLRDGSLGGRFLCPAQG